MLYYRDQWLSPVYPPVDSFQLITKELRNLTIFRVRTRSQSFLKHKPRDRAGRRSGWARLISRLSGLRSGGDIIQREYDCAICKLTAITVFTCLQRLQICCKFVILLRCKFVQIWYGICNKFAYEFEPLQIHLFVL